MVTFKKYVLEGDVVPQAIFWRPLKYFSASNREGEDGLDVFRVSSFIIGNEIQFDLRTYRRHHKFMVTLYLSNEHEDEAEILEIIQIVVKELIVPKDAVAWKRGEAFEFGRLKRPKADRLREAEARILALKIASICPDRTASTEEIKREVPNYIEFSPADLAQSTTRPKEKMWQQIIGNVISHKGSPSGVFLNGYARRIPGGLSVTDKGMDYLKSMGFFDSVAALTE